MNIIKKLPGSLLVFIGAVCLSFGGLIIKSFESDNLWQILFWRQFFFSIIVVLYLLITYKKNFFKSFYISGIPGFIGGIFLGIGFAADFSDLGGFADKPASEAAIYFVELVNCAGGVNGSPIEFTVKNIEGDPEVTQRAGQELVDAGVSAILGPPFPDFGEPLLQVTAGKVATLFVASTEPTLADASAMSFLVAFDDTAQATAAAKFALDQGWKTAVTFSAPGPYFGYNPVIFTKVFEAGGGKVTTDYAFVPIDDMDFSAQANAMASAGSAPDVVYSAMLSFQSAVLRGQLDGAVHGVERCHVRLLELAIEHLHHVLLDLRNGHEVLHKAADLEYRRVRLCALALQVVVDRAQHALEPSVVKGAGQCPGIELILVAITPALARRCAQV